MTKTKDNSPHWYAARVKYRTEHKIKAFLEEKEMKHFIPFRRVAMERNGKKIQKDKPVISCLIFVYTDYHTALSLPVESGFSITYIRNIETKKVQVIPDKQMQDFMLILDLSETGGIQILTQNLKRGDKVRVIKGVFTGVEGELVRIKGHKRVVVRLEGVFSLATTYIPSEYLELIESPE
ncbi:MAG: UpxY family transcription antiterminator [Dysgonamonadaceae bacterium]|jgi:transcription antitermination factor NusG|nr:UpxY family transcription antiterminator [Dysgonamonadaceae bacterium]